MVRFCGEAQLSRIPLTQVLAMLVRALLCALLAITQNVNAFTRAPNITDEWIIEHASTLDLQIANHTFGFICGNAHTGLSTEGMNIHLSLGINVR